MTTRSIIRSVSGSSGLSTNVRQMEQFTAFILLFIDPDTIYVISGRDSDATFQGCFLRHFYFFLSHLIWHWFNQFSTLLAEVYLKNYIETGISLLYCVSLWFRGKITTPKSRFKSKLNTVTQLRLYFQKVVISYKALNGGLGPDSCKRDPFFVIEGMYSQTRFRAPFLIQPPLNKFICLTRDLFHGQKIITMGCFHDTDERIHCYIFLTVKNKQGPVFEIFSTASKKHWTRLAPLSFIVWKALRRNEYWNPRFRAFSEFGTTRGAGCEFGERVKCGYMGTILSDDATSLRGTQFFLFLQPFLLIKFLPSNFWILFPSLLFYILPELCI